MGAIRNALTGAWWAWRNANTSGRGCHPSSMVMNTTRSAVTTWSMRGATPGGGAVVVVGATLAGGALAGAERPVRAAAAATRGGPPPDPSHRVAAGTDAPTDNNTPTPAPAPPPPPRP